MRHRPGKPNSRQEAAFGHDDVATIAALVVANPDLRLVKLAEKLSLARTPPSDSEVHGLIGNALYFDADLGDVARDVASRAAAIGSAPVGDDRVRRRGALLERLTDGLVRSRLPTTTFHEHEVELKVNPRSRRQWTHSKEIVAEGDAFEVYECKANCLPDPGDVDELSDVASTAKAEGTEALPTLVVFGSIEQLRRMSVAWRLTETIYAVPTEAILDLRLRPPKRFALAPIA